MNSVIKGRVWRFGDNIDTDIIIPGRYLRTFSLDELASHVMEGIDPEFASKVRKGDIIVAGRNFGCGSSREQAPVALKHAGVSAIIAESFARIFYRNAINIGLPVIMADVDAEDGDEIRADLREGVIENITRQKKYRMKPFNDYMLSILEDGGLVKHYLRTLGVSEEDEG
ncbi:homoaconitase small subunit [Methanothermobacter wolfeii]|uniref:Methanogen homoaconitase small subunit n=1 Tax=Methanothermobacter wolfeii TaxID=145261 RepID=A0A9E7UMR2_METWO|nr:MULTISPECIES: homoaconitase small subunit [Methanothermobacter]MDI6702251.1 homoaconitase small subunit [Methanothermobacter wolfeii]MDI6842355.1 homoaconitase small subunit [Methanothermobacter wolfeii]NLM02330.1 3-isopropylmalate dehydratase small subunit [Methanothermobacter wolfeii]QHN06586.1 3-isopropylmalate dehydratase small subunit [Methanothermobacter sp. THM-1]UXH31131.1 homoaconitase small subunit [Methanothermobacter wolfeii]